MRVSDEGVAESGVAAWTASPRPQAGATTLLTRRLHSPWLSCALPRRGCAVWELRECHPPRDERWDDMRKMLKLFSRYGALQVVDQRLGHDQAHARCEAAPMPVRVHMGRRRAGRP